MKNIIYLLSVLLLCSNLSISQDGPTVYYNMEEGTLDADPVWYHNVIETKNAWKITRGIDDVVIVYLCRSGINWEHEKIRTSYDNINRTDEGEEPWITWNGFIGNGTDDDANGVIDDWRGIKRLVLPETYVNNTLHTFYDPDHIDGTWLAGIISGINEDVAFTDDFYSAAGGVNQRGITVVPFSYDELPDGPHAWLWNDALNYAIEIGAEIFLYDFCTLVTSSMELKLEEARNAGIFIVAPSGWDGATINLLQKPAGFTFPWSFNFPYFESVFSVGGSTKPDFEGLEYRHPLAHYGLYPTEDGDFLDLVAPAEKIYTTSADIYGSDDEYKWIQGNAASAAMVAATAGLMLSVNPDLETLEIRDILRETADKINNQDNGGDYNYNWNGEYPGHSKECGYGRLNTYRAVCAALASAPPIEVVDNDVWDEPKFSLNTITIPEDYTLTITSTVSMGPEAKIIVYPGAKLILDGGTLTNYKFCGYENTLWPGVEVWGTSIKSQFPCQGVLNQGTIEIKNGGIIENARIGVLLGAHDGTNFILQKAGGIIWVANSRNEELPGAKFLNNERSVFFITYDNFTINQANCAKISSTNNRSFLQNCYFEVDGDYFEGAWTTSHIYLLGVKGVAIQGCTFINTNTTEPSGHGINSYWAGFIVDAICNSSQSPCPEQSLDKCTFTNFYKGINLIDAGTRAFTVKNALFTDNSFGIMLSNVNNATVLFSDFYLGKPAECGLDKDAAIGIDLLRCTGFAIEENHFEKGSTVYSGDYVGIRCKDSQTRYDIIYKNTFSDLSFGNFAEGMNRYNPNYDWDGLEYRCNINTGNIVDFKVTTYDPSLAPAMIRGYMGYTNISAGNTFSQQSGVDWHFLNLGTQQIDYWWYSGNSIEEPEYYCTFGPNPYPDPCYFTPYNTSPENTCPSHYAGGGSGGSDERSVLLTPQQFQETELTYIDALNDFNNIKSLYENLEDGGNTQALNSEVENAFPSDMWQIRSELLGVSPHVSKEVLMTTADKTDVFPESVLFEILSANPDELKNGDMISFLENKEDPLPSYMIDMLKQIAGGETYKTILKRQMADFQAWKSQAANDIIRSILADSVLDRQLYRNWLDNLGNIEADKQIIASYIDEGDYTSAQTLLNLVPSLYELDENSLLEFNDYKSLTEFLIGIEQQNRIILELETSEIDFLANFAENSSGTAKEVARGILNFGYGYNYCNCLPADSLGLKSSAVDFEKSLQYNGFFVNAEPNPADSWVAFNFKIPSYVDEAILKITDIEGRQIISFYISIDQGQQIWDIREIKSGIYFYTLEAGNFKKSEKLIIK